MCDTQPTATRHENHKPQRTGQPVPSIGLWRSLAARFLGVEEVTGSNPVSPTSARAHGLSVKGKDAIRMAKSKRNPAVQIPKGGSGRL